MHHPCTRQTSTAPPKSKDGGGAREGRVEEDLSSIFPSGFFGPQPGGDFGIYDQYR